MNVRFVDAWNHRDPDSLAALFDDDAEFVNVTGLWWHIPRADPKRSRVRATRIFKDSSLQAIDVRVKRLSTRTRWSTLGRWPAGAAPRPTTPTSFREVKRHH